MIDLNGGARDELGRGKIPGTKKQISNKYRWPKFKIRN